MAQTDYVVRFTGQDNISSTVNKVKQDLTDVGKAGTTALDKINDKFNRIVNSTAPLKRQLRDIQGLMAQLNAKGLSNTDEYTRMAQEAGRLKDAITDAAAATARFSYDTMALQAGIQAFQGIAAAGTIATGVMGLFGTKNDEVQRAILKVQSALAILNGVQQIANTLNKDSVLVLKMKQIMTASSTVATNANTASNVANTISTKTNTNAQKAWNVAKAIGKAMLGDFTGLLILGAGALLTYGMVAGDSADEQNNLNNSINKGTTFIEKQNEARKEASKTITDEKYKISVLYGVITDVNTAYNDKVRALNELKKIIPTVNGVIDAEGVYHGNAASAIREHIKALDDLQKALALFKLGQKIQEELTDAQWQKYQADQNVNNKQNNIDASIRQVEKSTQIVKEESAKNIGHRDTQRQIQASNDLRTANEQLIENRENLELAKDNQKEADKVLTTAQQQAQQFNTFSKQQGISSKAMAAVALAGGDPTKATDYFIGRNNINNGGGGGKGRITPKTNKTTDKEEVKYLANSLAALEKELSDTQSKLRNGLIPDEKIEATKKNIEELKEQIKAKKIYLGLEVDPKIKADEEAKQKLEKDLQQLSKDFEGIEFKPHFSTYDKALGNGGYNLNTLDGIESQMNFNDNLISQLNSILDLYKSLGIEGGEAFNKVADSVNKLYNEQTELSEKAVKVDKDLKKQTAVKEKFEGATDAIYNFGSALSSLSNAIQLPALDIAGTMAQAIATMVQGYATATAQAASLGPWAWIAFAATGLAQLTAIVSSVKNLQQFAEGGIVGGASKYGDRVLARVNSGEMILNGKQQRNLFNAINNGNFGNGNTGQNVTFKIKGSDLYGALKNYGKIQSKVGKGFAL